MKNKLANICKTLRRVPGIDIGNYYYSSSFPPSQLCHKLIMKLGQGKDREKEKHVRIL